ncbi:MULTISPECIES: hypothetical protein [Arthrobacter]|uniref:Lipoprotein n=2 Tax=Arthrobacter TaxID=1663 RepID=A0ABU9KJA0_9MICC|nr:hypothetical protein [Arthrobacter sp. YJM1]MDP5226214.1 hypothetical protein [Arthrobacter sp. YJM1]
MSQHATLSGRGLAALALLTLGAGLTACSPGPQDSSAPSTAPSSASPPSSAPAPTASPTQPAALPSGFPTALLPTMPGMALVTRSLATQGDFSTIAFNATVTAKPADVEAFYAQRFTAQGFAAPAATTVDGVLTRMFVRSNGDETISLSVADAAGGGSAVTIGATVRAGSVK